MNALSLIREARESGRVVKYVVLNALSGPKSGVRAKSRGVGVTRTAQLSEKKEKRLRKMERRSVRINRHKKGKRKMKC